MKKTILAAFAAAAALALAAIVIAPNFVHAAPNAAHAGKGGAPAGKGGDRMKKMADALGLTDAQKAQIKPILMNSRAQAKAIQANTALTPDVKKDQLKTLRKSTNQQIMALLTPDQRAKMKAMRAERREAKQGKG